MYLTIRMLIVGIEKQVKPQPLEQNSNDGIINDRKLRRIIKNKRFQYEIPIQRDL